MLAIIGTLLPRRRAEGEGSVSGEGESEKREKGREWLGYNYDSR